MIILLIRTTSLIRFSLKGCENLLFEGRERAEVVWAFALITGSLNGRLFGKHVSCNLLSLHVSRYSPHRLSANPSHGHCANALSVLQTTTSASIGIISCMSEPSHCNNVTYNIYCMLPQDTNRTVVKLCCEIQMTARNRPFHVV